MDKKYLIVEGYYDFLFYTSHNWEQKSIGFSDGALAAQ